MDFRCGQVHLSAGESLNDLVGSWEWYGIWWDVWSIKSIHMGYDPLILYIYIIYIYIIYIYISYIYIYISYIYISYIYIYIYHIYIYIYIYISYIYISYIYIYHIYIYTYISYNRFHISMNTLHTILILCSQVTWWISPKLGWRWSNGILPAVRPCVNQWYPFFEKK